MTNEELLAEVEDLLRITPPRATIRHETPENHSWLGRVMATLNLWDSVTAVPAQFHLKALQGSSARGGDQAYTGLIVLLHQARHDLRMKTVGPMNAVVPAGMVFEYFDEMRKIIEGASKDILFVDPYLDAEFVSQYLPQIKPDVGIRLLASKYIDKLVPAIKAFAQQNNAIIELRSASSFHDRYVFVDGENCYHSGASFKDGAKNSPTMINQITDAFSAVCKTYEDIWEAGEIIEL